MTIRPGRIPTCVALLGAWSGMLAAGARAHGHCQYDVTIIETPSTAKATDINVVGDVVGYYAVTFETDQAFLWTSDGGLLALPMPPGYLTSRAYAINDSGQVVGTMGGYSTPRRAFLFDGQQVIDLGTLPGGNFSEGLSLNNAGQVVGYWGDNVDGDPAAWSAFVWADGRMYDLGLSELGPTSQATDINQAGQVTGVKAMSLWEDALAYVWDDGDLTEIPPVPDGYLSWGDAINDRGDVAGRSILPPGINIRHAFLWADGETLDLHTLPEFTRSLARDLNDTRQVVGYCDSGGGATYAFIWQHGQMALLEDLIPPGLHLSTARGINERGWIAASGGGWALVLKPLPLDGDLNGDCTVGIVDMLALLAAWGPCADCGDCPADLDGDCVVGITDLLDLLDNWH